ncbi:MAG: PDZ domain-containing protein, partial [Planctomycetota bacterium]|nr:PDZ domain-containing protein [Planctomycetota bacterium]
EAARAIIEAHVNDPNDKIRRTAELSVKKNSPAATGYLVTNVEEKLPAAKAGLVVGHIITSINGKAIQSGRDIISTIGAAQEGQVLTVTVHDGSSTKTLNLTKAGRRIGVFGDSVKVGK